MRSSAARLAANRANAARSTGPRTPKGKAASSRSSAPSSSLTAIRRAWNTRVAGSIGGLRQERLSA